MYRKGIGAIVVNTKMEMIAFQREDFKNRWQGVEGGIEKKDTPLETLFKETSEEIGLKQEDYTILKETKNFIRYKFPEYWTKNSKKGRDGFDGQEKKFFLIQLKNDNYEFNFKSTDEAQEFASSKIVTNMEDFLEEITDFKRDMYVEVLKEFGFIK